MSIWDVNPTIIYTDEDSYWYTNKSFFYLLGFQPSLGYMIYEEDKITIILDSRYFEKLDNIDEEDLFDKIYILKWNENKIELNFVLLNKSIEETLKENIPSREINIETSASLNFYKKLVNFWFGVNTISPIFEKTRIIKDISEVKSIKKAIIIIAKVWRQIEKLNKTWELNWKTEIWLRKFIINKIFEFGWEAESFDSIVAFWENSAIPHHQAWITKIKTWPLLVDMWAFYEWYASDFTRTLWAWQIPLKSSKNYEKYKEFKKIQGTVKKAHDEALKFAKPWIKCAFLDKLARDYIVEAWYWKYFTHSTWHGVWLNIHESPYISSKSNEIIESWMVFTIEPWIYMPWNFWIRYENIIIII